MAGAGRLLVVLAVLGVALATPASAELYRWTDADGIVRYTNDPAAIPPEYRDAAKDIGSPQPRAAEPVPVSRGIVVPFAPGEPIKVAAHLNGVPLTLMVDTGADRTVLSPAVIGRAGFGAEPGRAVRILGVTGEATAREIDVDWLDLARLRVGPLRVVIYDVGLPGIDGIVGRDVLDLFTFTVDAAAGRATLVPR